MPDRSGQQTGDRARPASASKISGARMKGSGLKYWAHSKTAPLGEQAPGSQHEILEAVPGTVLAAESARRLRSRGYRRRSWSRTDRPDCPIQRYEWTYQGRHKRERYRPENARPGRRSRPGRARDASEIHPTSARGDDGELDRRQLADSGDAHEERRGDEPARVLVVAPAEERIETERAEGGDAELDEAGRRLPGDHRRAVEDSGGQQPAQRARDPPPEQARSRTPPARRGRCAPAPPARRRGGRSPKREEHLHAQRLIRLPDRRQLHDPARVHVGPGDEQVVDERVDEARRGERPDDVRRRCKQRERPTGTDAASAARPPAWSALRCARRRPSRSRTPPRAGSTAATSRARSGARVRARRWRRPGTRSETDRERRPLEPRRKVQLQRAGDDVAVSVSRGDDQQKPPESHHAGQWCAPSVRARYRSAGAANCRK